MTNDDVVAQAGRTRNAMAEVKDINARLDLVEEYFGRTWDCHWSDELDKSAEEALKVLTQIDSKMSAIYVFLLDHIDAGY